MLAALLSRNQGGSKTQFKIPKYAGTTEVTLFIQHFRDVAAANRWSERESTLHLRASLEGEALDCGRGKTTDEILEGLRSRFGMSQDKAQTKLQTLRRQPKQSLHALGAELTKLAEIAYPDQGETFRRRTVISCFYRAVNNRELEHLLANNKQTTLAETIRVAEDHIMRDERHAHPPN